MVPALSSPNLFFRKLQAIETRDNNKAFNRYLLKIASSMEQTVKVRLYLDKDQVDYQYSQSRFLVQKGIKTRISSNSYIMHHKFAIIDNRILLTGSYNWTFSANHRNDENLMVIDDPEIIEIFQKQFVNLWTNKYSLERTRELYKIAKVDFVPPSPTSAKLENKVININTASQDELIKILQISKPPARKIIDPYFMSFPLFPLSFPRKWESIILSDELRGFEEPKDLLQFTEITDLEWEEWEEQGIILNVQ